MVSARDGELGRGGSETEKLEEEWFLSTGLG